MHPRRLRPVAALTLALVAAPFLAASAVAAQSTPPPRAAATTAKHTVHAAAAHEAIVVPQLHWLSATTASIQHVVDVVAFAAAKAAAVEATPPPPPPSAISDPLTWIWPGNGPITSPFGSRWGRRHEGVDIDAGYGTRVVAPQRGVVIAAGPGQTGYGLVVQIAHGDGITTLFAHLSKVLARVGQPVAQGDTIGLVGATGSVTAAHLHYEVHVAGVPRNPMPWLRGAHSMQGHPG
jgi:murein DD-endopeptidase MepM/ murein hydrolase activator NlpD